MCLPKVLPLDDTSLRSPVHFFLSFLTPETCMHPDPSQPELLPVFCCPGIAQYIVMGYNYL